MLALSAWKRQAASRDFMDENREGRKIYNMKKQSNEKGQRAPYTEDIQNCIDESVDLGS